MYIMYKYSVPLEYHYHKNDGEMSAAATRPMTRGRRGFPRISRKVE